MTLPIETVLEDVKTALRGGTGLVLVAPPGAGKTTRVPLALLDADWLQGGRIVMLEPRRLAARAASGYMARLLGEDVGQRVGYRTRLDTRVGPATRIEVVTEGVLTRMLQSDPALEGTGLVIFDEFHERSLNADLGLALCLHMRELIRPELRVLVMSATLDAAPVADLLGSAPVIRSEGRAYDVETVHLTQRPRGRIEDLVASTVIAALDQDQGDILVFLPGAGEIRRVQERLGGRPGGPDMGTARPTLQLPPGVNVHPLFGNLPRETQDRAIAPSPAGRRKVVLATSIAETSLTIEGVRIVVDSGLMRVPRFSPRTGMTRLDTVPVTRDSADQRRGRAGRTAPGVCYRLWTIEDEHGLIERRTPEIREADLASLALELAAWGIEDPATLRWLDLPAAAAFGQARELLVELGALGADGVITEHGRDLVALPAHPRIGHMLTRARRLGTLGTACDLAALLGDRDVLKSDAPDPDLGLRLDLLESARAGRFPQAVAGNLVDRGALQRTLTEAGSWRKRLRVPDRSPAVAADAGLLLAFAYPDRIGKRRAGRGKFLLRNGRGAAIDPHRPLAGEEYIVAAELAGHGRESAVWRAAALEAAALQRHFADQIRLETEVAWDSNSGAVRARRIERLGAIEIRASAVADPDPEAVTAAFLDGIRSAGVAALPWSEEAHWMRQRIAFLHTLEPDEWPDPGDDALADVLEGWLAPWLHGKRGLADLEALDWVAVLTSWLGRERSMQLERAAPTHCAVPSGSRIRIDYSDPAAPTLAVRLQEVFGLIETPRTGNGRVPLTMRLLSPARRPVQVTRDLASFWKTGYFEVRKDLRARYPKHAWPEDPLTATPTRGVRRRH